MKRARSSGSVVGRMNFVLGMLLATDVLVSGGQYGRWSVSSWRSRVGGVSGMVKAMDADSIAESASHKTKVGDINWATLPEIEIGRMVLSYMNSFKWPTPRQGKAAAPGRINGRILLKKGVAVDDLRYQDGSKSGSSFSAGGHDASDLIGVAGGVVLMIVLVDFINKISVNERRRKPRVLSGPIRCPGRVAMPVHTVNDDRDWDSEHCEAAQVHPRSISRRRRRT